MASSRFIADQQLTKKDLAAIQNYLAKVTDKWTDIGVQLQVDPDYLEELRSNKKSSGRDNTRRMVLTWLKGEECVPTWKALCDALRAPAVGEIGIAEQIEREQLQYSGEEQNDGGLPSQTTNENPEEDVEESQILLPSPEESHEADDTTTVISPVVEPFLFLNTSGLSASEKDELFGRLLEESIAIRLSFVLLQSDIEISLISRNIEALRIYEEMKSANIHYHERITGLVDIPAMMGKLREYLSFFDYSLLEFIVQKFGTSEDQTNLDAYKQSLAEFSQRRIFECPEGIFSNGFINEEKEATVHWIDAKTILYDLTLSQIQTFTSNLCRELDLHDSDMRLVKCMKSEQGLELRFGILSSAATECFPLPESGDKKEHLVSLGVWKIECGDYTFEHKQNKADVESEKEPEEEEEPEEPEPKPDEKEVSSTNEHYIEFKNTIISTDEDVGPHTSISINDKKVIVEVSNNSTSSYKSYKVGRRKGETLEWLSSARGLRYGMGKSPRISLNNEGYVVEVDEETNGHLSCRVGIVHSSNVMMWTESSIFTAGSNPSIALCFRTVIVAFKRAEDAFYRVGSLDIDTRSITWSAQDHRFINGVSDLAIACNPDGLVVSVYTKQTVSMALSSVYAIAGVLQSRERKVLFSSAARNASLSICEGTCPSVAVSRGNSVVMTCIQHKTGIQRKIKYRLGLAKKAVKNNTYTLVWSSGEETLDTTGRKASVAMCNKGNVLISYSNSGRSICHIGKTHVHRETTI